MAHRVVRAVGAFDLTRPAARSRTGVLRFPDAAIPVGDEPRVVSYLPDRRLAFLPVVVKPGSEPETYALLALRVGPDGGLTEAGRYSSDEAAMRAFPVGDRFVVVTTGSVAILDPDGLRLLRSAPTATREWNPYGV